jgi:hypothetical protein
MILHSEQWLPEPEEPFDMGIVTLDLSIAEAVINGQMTPDEADECRRSYLDTFGE